MPMWYSQKTEEKAYSIVLFMIQVRSKLDLKVGDFPLILIVWKMYFKQSRREKIA